MPSARNHRIALDCASRRPSSSSSTGVSRSGLSAAERVGQRVAGEDVDRHPLVLPAEQAEQQADLEAVPGGGVVVEAHAPPTRARPHNVSRLDRGDFLLLRHAEGRAAAAGRDDVRVVDLEAGALHGLDVVDDRAACT